MDLLCEVKSYLRACAFCGYSWGKIDWICEGCEKEFLTRLSLKTRFIGSTKHLYLIDWKPGDTFVDRLVYSLKGEGLFQSYLNLVLIFSSFQGVEAPDGIYYPSKGKRDHGYQWAKSFSQVYGCPMKELRIQQTGKQSLLGRSERTQRGLVGTPISAKNPYFVDDIVTTGATARAALKEVDQQGKLTIWSLFYRRTL